MSITEEKHKVGIIDKLIPVIFILASILIAIEEILPAILSIIADSYVSDLETLLSRMMDYAGIFVIWVVLLYLGGSGLWRLYRFRKYVKKIGNLDSIELIYFADLVDETEEFVIKDLKKMIKKGWFSNAYLDLESDESRLIITK